MHLMYRVFLNKLELLSLPNSNSNVMTYLFILNKKNCNDIFTFNKKKNEQQKQYDTSKQNLL